MQREPPTKNRIAEAMFRRAPVTKDTSMNTSEMRMITIPTALDAGCLQKNEAIMLTSGPPRRTAGTYHPASSSPSVAADTRPAHIDAHSVLGRDSMNPNTPKTIGAAVLGFRRIVSFVSLIVYYSVPIG